MQQALLCSHSVSKGADCLLHSWASAALASFARNRGSRSLPA
jgi:hypothetical protein